MKNFQFLSKKKDNKIKILQKQKNYFKTSTKLIVIVRFFQCIVQSHN